MSLTWQIFRFRTRIQFLWAPLRFSIADGVWLYVVDSASVLSFRRFWGGPEWVLRDGWKAAVSYESSINDDLVTKICG